MIFRPAKRIAFAAYGNFPEGRFKHWTRAIPLSFLSSLPRRAFINPGDCVLQIGTPSPATAHYILDIIGRSGRLIIVEPESNNIQNLTTDDRIQQSENVTIVEKAAWNCRETLEFTVSKSCFDHKIAIPGIIHDNDYVDDNYQGTQQVQADTVDNILEELGISHVDYAEIHVNGAEVEVLRGMQNALGFVERIHLKGHSLDAGNNRPINEEMVAILRERGFVTKIAAPSKARTEAAERAAWDRRAGDVYAARLR